MFITPISSKITYTNQTSFKQKMFGREINTARKVYDYDFERSYNQMLEESQRRIEEYRRQVEQRMAESERRYQEERRKIEERIERRRRELEVTMQDLDIDPNIASMLDGLLNINRRSPFRSQDINAEESSQKIKKEEKIEMIKSTPLSVIERELISTDNSLRVAALDDILEYINSEEYNPNAKDYLGRNIIHIAMLSKDEKTKNVIAKAIAKGTDINTVNMNGLTPLMEGIKNFIGMKDYDEKAIGLSIVKFILNQNPDINIQDKNGFTALHYACLSQSVGLLEMILSKTPDVSLKTSNGKTGLDFLKNPKMIEVYRKHFPR